MTETSRPWAGAVTGDKGPYTDEDWQEQFRHMTGSGFNLDSIVIPDSGTVGKIALEIIEDSPASADVRLRAGSAFVYGTLYINSAIMDVTIPSNGSGNARIDTVALQWDSTAQTVRVVVVEGTPHASPTPPTLTNSATVKEIPQADIAVANGFSSITQANITPRAKPTVFNNLVLAIMQNNSGSDIGSGRVVELHTTSDRSVQVSDAIADAFGITVGDIPDTDWGIVCLQGIIKVYGEDATTRGEALVNGATAGELSGEANANQPRIAIALETTSAEGFCLALVEVTKLRNFSHASYSTDNSAYTTTSASMVLMDGTNLSDTIPIRTGKAICFFSCYINNVDQFYFDLLLDSLTYGSGGTHLGLGVSASTQGDMRLTMSHLFTGLSEGDHQFDVTFLNVSGSGSGTIDDCHWIVREVE